MHAQDPFPAMQRVRTYPLADRPSLVRVADFCSVPDPGADFEQFIDSLPDIYAGKWFKELVERIESAPSPRWQTSPYELRNPYGRAGWGGRRSKAREETTYAYEDEDQSVIGVRVGMRVRHRQFGVGTVVAVEDQGDDIKVTVRFAAVGTKKLLARFANLEPA